MSIEHPQTEPPEFYEASCPDCGEKLDGSGDDVCGWEACTVCEYFFEWDN